MDGKEIWMGKIRMGRIDQVRSAKLERRRIGEKGRMSSVFLPFFLFLSTIYKRYRKNFTAVFYSKRIRAKSGDKLLHPSLLSPPTMRFKSRVNASKF